MFDAVDPFRGVALQPDTTGWTTDMCRVLELERQRRLIDAEEAELLARLETSGDTDAITGFSTAQWLADVARMSPSAARQRVRVAERLLDGRFGPLAEALGAGRVGWQHAAFFDRVANPRIVDDMCVLLPELLDLADVATFDRWSKELRGIAARLDDDGGYDPAEDPAEDPANNHLKLTLGMDGVTHLSGTLVGELALMVRAIIDAGTDKILERHRADRTELKRQLDEQARLRGDTGGESHTDASDDTDGDLPKLPSRAQCAAEALAELLDLGANVPDGQGRMCRPEAVIIIEEDTDLTADAADPDASWETTRRVTDQSGNTLSLTVLRFVLAAGLIRPLEVTKPKDALRMGFTLRYAGRDQRRALAYRDGGCIFPGCNQPPERTDAHHVDHWHPPDCNDHPDNDADGCDDCDGSGPTDIENLALLCRHHHRVTHRAGWIMTRWHSDQLAPGEIRFRWQTPSGGVLYSQRHQIRPS